MIVRHVVLFKFRDDTPEARIREIESSFCALPSKVPEVVALEWGTNVSPEGLNEGFTHCFLLTFESATDRDRYLVDPAHVSFVDQLRPLLDRALVVDYRPSQLPLVPGPSSGS